MKTEIIPSIFFTTDSTYDTYFLRYFYKEYVLPRTYYPYQFDGWYDKKFYGNIDLQNNIIYPKLSYLKEYSNNFSVQHKNLAFVTDAFIDLKKFQNDLLKRNKINNISIYTNLNVVSSTEDFPSLYLNYLNKFYNIFLNTFLDSEARNNIKNIDNFIKYFIKFISNITKVAPVNRSQFIKHRMSPQSINGLRIALDNPSSNSDLKKLAQTYIGDPEFDQFVEIASKYGFMIDRNMPWTIVADINSPNLLKYAKKYNLYSTEEIFETCYHKAYIADIESLKNIILGFWNSYATTVASSNKVNKNQNTKNALIEINSYNQLTIQNFEKIYNLNWQLRLYLYIRILEEKLDISQAKFEVLYSEVLNINKFYNLPKALDYVNKKLSELSARKQIRVDNLTTADSVVKLLATKSNDLPVEGINF